MPDSNITVSLPTLVPQVGQIKVSWTYTDPNVTEGGHAPFYVTLAAVEVWVSLINDRELASYAGEGISDFALPGIAEETVVYVWLKARNGAGGHGEWSSGLTAGVPCRAAGMAGLLFVLSNGRIDATVASNVLTVAIKTKGGTDPSPIDPIHVALRDETASDGNYQIVQINTPLSASIDASGLSYEQLYKLGTTNNEPFRFWVLLLFDAGNPKLGLVNCSAIETLGGLLFHNTYSLDEQALVSSSDESSVLDPSATGVGVIRTDVAVANSPFRILGHLTWSSGLPVAGQYSVGPDRVQLFGPGIKKPGDVVKTSFVSQGQTSGTTTVPLDNSSPLSTEGDSVIFNNFTPTSTVNVLEHDLHLHVSASTATTAIASIFLSGNSIAVSAQRMTGDQMNQLRVAARHRAPSATQLTFVVNVGGQAGTLYVGGATGYLLGNAMRSTYTIREYMV